MRDDNINNEVLFKLGAIGTEVRGIADNLNSAIHRLEEKIESTAKLQTESVTELKARLKNAEAKIDFLEQWRQALFTKLGFVVSGVSVFWLVLGQPIEKAVKTLFGN